MAGIPTISGVAEHLLHVAAVGSDAHVLLAQRASMVLQIVLLLRSMSMTDRR